MRRLTRYEGRTVVIHQAVGHSLQGVLLHAYRDCFVLAHGRSLDAQEDLKGEIVVPRAPGVWIQATVPEPSP